MAVEFITEFGCVLGTYQGVDGLSNGSDYHYSGEQNFVGGVYTGIKYQCVEYARRWLLSKNLEFHTVPFASHVWKVKFFINSPPGLNYYLENGKITCRKKIIRYKLLRN